jgi:hypothetical protein
MDNEDNVRNDLADYQEANYNHLSARAAGLQLSKLFHVMILHLLRDAEEKFPDESKFGAPRIAAFAHGHFLLLLCGHLLPPARGGGWREKGGKGEEEDLRRSWRRRIHHVNVWGYGWGSEEEEEDFRGRWSLARGAWRGVDGLGNHCIVLHKKKEATKDSNSTRQVHPFT